MSGKARPYKGQTPNLRGIDLGDVTVSRPALELFLVLESRLNGTATGYAKFIEALKLAGLEIEAHTGLPVYSGGER